MLFTYPKTANSNHEFFNEINPFELIKEFGSPLYVYNEQILRLRCKEMKKLIAYPHFTPNYSSKANCNIELIKIIKDEGFHIDAMSPGEIFVHIKAGYKPNQILYIGNNVSLEELKFAVDRKVTVSVDSLSQLELFGKNFPGHKVVVRFNGGVGAGHHDKVVTAGKNTKFGVDPKFVSMVKNILSKYQLKLIGINQHIGSLFLTGDSYLQGSKSLLSIAKEFDDLEFVDFGGGFGVPYKRNQENRLDLNQLGHQLDDIIDKWIKDYGKEISFKVEPGRYIVAECGMLLGEVYSTKINYEKKYIGTDLGFNVLMRPVMYNAHHDIEVYTTQTQKSLQTEKVTIVGNICESGDIIANERDLPLIHEGDIIGISNAGAYGFAMCSNYNNRLRPAEVLLKTDGTVKLIRRRDTYEDIVANY